MRRQRTASNALRDKLRFPLRNRLHAVGVRQREGNAMVVLLPRLGREVRVTFCVTVTDECPRIFDTRKMSRVENQVRRECVPKVMEAKRRVPFGARGLGLASFLSRERQLSESAAKTGRARSPMRNSRGSRR